MEFPVVFTHPSCLCRWCTKPLVRIDQIWWCSTPACARRQLKYAVARKDAQGKVQYLYVPAPAQVEWQDAAYQKSLRRILIGGSASPGKSKVIREVLYRFAQQVPGLHALLLRRTFNDLNHSHIRFLPYEVEERGGTWKVADKIAVFHHADAPDSVIRTGYLDADSDVINYLSAEYDVIAPDELVTFNRDPMLELFTRARTTNPHMIALRGSESYDGAFVFAASNPGGRGSAWVKDLFIDHTPDPDEFGDYIPEYWKFFPAFLRDNPYIKAEGYAQTLSNLRDARKRQLLDGDWDVFEGKYFDNFKPATHVVSYGTLSLDYRRFLSLDWGLNQPGCVLFWVCLPDGHYHIEGEFKFNGEVGNRLYAKDVATALKQRCREIGLQKVPKTWVDPDITLNKGQIGESIADTLTRWGVPCVKATNDRINGWQRVYEMLRTAPDGTPWLTFDPSCRYLLRTLPLQVCDRNKPEDINTHGDDHAADALRYGAMSCTRPGSLQKSNQPPPAYSPAWFRQLPAQRYAR